MRHFSLLAAAFACLFVTACASPERAWETALQRNTIAAYQEFLQVHPDGPLAGQSRQRIEEIRWATATKENTEASYTTFLEQAPNGRLAPEARAHILGLAWDAANAAGTAQAVRDFLRRTGETPKSAVARARLEELDWSDAQSAGTTPAFRRFVSDHPKSERRQAAERFIAELAWRKASADGSVVALRRFIDANPKSEHAATATTRVEALELETHYRDACAADSMVAYEEFLGLHGDSKHQPEIRRRLADAAWRDALAADSIESVVAFLGRFPDHARADDARSRLHDLRWKAVCAEPTLGSYETFVADFPQSPHLPAASASIKSLLVSFAKMEWRIEAVGTASLSEVAGRNDWTVVRVQVRSPIGSPSLVLDSKRFSALDAGGVATPLAAAEVVAAMEVRPETTALGPATPFAPSEYAVARSSIRYSSSGRVRYLDISIGGTTRPRFMLTMLSESDSHTTLPFEACAGWRVLLVFSSPPDKVRKLNLLGRSLKVAPPGTEEGATWVDLQLSPASEWPIHVDPGLALNLGKLAKGQAHKARFVLRSKSGEDLSGAKARLAAPSATGSASVRAIAEGKDLIVEVVVTESAEGLVRGEILVELNLPDLKSVPLSFSGFVR